MQYGLVYSQYDNLAIGHRRDVCRWFDSEDARDEFRATAYKHIKDFRFKELIDIDFDSYLRGCRDTNLGQNRAGLAGGLTPVTTAQYRAGKGDL